MLGFGSSESRMPGWGEWVSWLPALGLSTMVGVGSLTQEQVDWPFFVNFMVGLYQTFVYPVVNSFAEATPEWLIDVGAIGLGVATLAARWYFNFTGSVLTFALIAAGVGYFIL